LNPCRIQKDAGNQEFTMTARCKNDKATFELHRTSFYNNTMLRSKDIERIVQMKARVDQ